MNTDRKNSHFSLQRLTMMAMLIACQIILSRWFSISTTFVKIGFGFIPIVLAARYLGVAEGILVAALSDLIGAYLFPVGTLYLGFTLTAAVRGGIYGLYLHKKTTTANIVLSVLTTEFICSICMNSFWLSLYYGQAFWALMPSRLIQAIIMSVIEVLILCPLLKKSGPIFNKYLSIGEY